MYDANKKRRKGMTKQEHEQIKQITEGLRKLNTEQIAFVAGLIEGMTFKRKEVTE